MHRLVERVVPADLLDQLRIGALAQHGPGRIAQADRGEREDEQADAQQDRQQRENSLGRGLYEVGNHCAVNRRAGATLARGNRLLFHMRGPSTWPPHSPSADTRRADNPVYSIFTLRRGARNSGAVERGERSSPFTVGRIRARLA